METLKEIPFEEHQYFIGKQGADSDHTKPKSVEQTNAEEQAFKKMCSDLPLHQDKIKRDKDLYKEEFNKFMAVFTPKFYAFLETPSKNHPLIKEILVFLGHISHIYPQKLAFVPAELLKLLEHSFSIIYSDIRLAIIDCFNLLRKKDLIPATE